MPSHQSAAAAAAPDPAVAADPVLPPLAIVI
jgi:hypothetical protein